MADISVGVTEAESLALTGNYQVEAIDLPGVPSGYVIRSTGTGYATGNFTGAVGNYWLQVNWINENDGVAQFAVLVNNVVVSSWSGTGGSNAVEIQNIEVALAPGDVITLRGIKNSGEPARIDSITIVENDSNVDPTALNDGFSTNINTALVISAPGVLANDEDLDGDTLSVSQIVSNVSNGTLAWNSNGSFTYTPNAAFVGTDSFTYQVSDGNGGLAQATVNITVEDPNALEGALIGVGLTEAESLDLAGAYKVESVDGFSGDAGIKSTGTGTATGSFTGADGSYWLQVDWFNENDGVAQFAVFVNNVQVSSWSGTGGNNSIVTRDIAVTLNYGDVITLRGIKNNGEPARIDSINIVENDGNTDPNAANDSYATNINSALVISAPGVLANDSDLNGDTLSVAQVLTNVSNGTLVWNSNGSFTYTPNAAFVGTDSFTYQVSDGNGGLAQATVNITVEDPNALEGALIGVGVTEAETLDLAGSYQYESVDGFSGDAGIKSTGTGTATGSFTGADGSYWLQVEWFNENDGVSKYTVLVNNVQVAAWSGTGGSNAMQTQNIAVTLNYGDVITLRGVKDAGEPARIDYINIVENDGNIEPTANNDSYVTNLNSALVINAPGVLANDTDLDGDTLNVSQILTNVSNGTLVWNANGSFTYTPNAAFVGQDSFTYQVSDGNGGLGQATVNITVEDPNALEGALIGVGTTEAESLDLAGAYQYESVEGFSGDAGIKSTGTGTATGSFAGADGTYWLQVNWFNENDGVSKYAVLVNGVQVSAWSGTGGNNSIVTQNISVSLEYGDVITLRGIKDAGEPARIDSINVFSNGGNVDPVASHDSYFTDANTQLVINSPGVLSNDNDLNGDTLSVSQIVTNVSNGSLSWSANGSFTYTPNSSFFGEDSFTYRVSDGNGGFDDATVTITVGVQGAVIDLGDTEAETLDLAGGYQFETVAGASGDAVIKTTGTGTAEGTFVGDDGIYWLDVAWLNEHDGAGQYKVLVNGEVVASWTGTGGEPSVTREVHRIGVELDAGDTITLQGTSGTGEPARIDTITLTERTPVYSGLDLTDYDYFAFAGQSNAERHFLRMDGDYSEGPMGYIAFEERMEELTGGMTTAINAATGGSGSNNIARSDLFWWNLNTDQPGQCLIDAVNDIQSGLGAGDDLDGIFWSQGETDAYAVDVTGNLTEAQMISYMVEATTSVFEYFWSVFGSDVPIFIQEMDNIDGYSTMPAIRQAQQDIADSYANVYIGSSPIGYDHFDKLHFDVDAYNDIAVELADSAFGVISDIPLV